MEHKAFIFDFDAFASELRPILERSLGSGNCEPLRTFISTNIADIRDPYEGEPITNAWGSMIDSQDPHQYGDFALTKYYDPKMDIGLGPSWEEAQSIVAQETPDAISPILGGILGTQDDPFDPGKLGSYFQSPDDVRRGIESLRRLAKAQSTALLNDAIEMLKKAASSEKGLYVTF